MTMSFQDFLERSASQLRTFNAHFLNAGPDLREVPPFSKSHIFHLGEDEKVVEATQEIKDDLLDEMSQGVPMPFDDVTCMSKVEGAWIGDRVIRTPRTFFKNLPEDATENKLVREIEPQEFLVIRFQECADMMVQWPILFVGISENGLLKMGHDFEWFHHFPVIRDTPPVCDAFTKMMIKNSTEILWDIAMISHPQNYVVKITPALSPRETRREKRGDTRPVRKSPHFIVVDHEVLVNMTRREPVGTHASPVPHHRRGHWKRLAQRCRHARLMGKEKVFVRPTYVGERVFSDDKHLYEVLLDFNEKKEAV